MANSTANDASGCWSRSLESKGGVWRLAFDAWRLALGAWRLALGVRRVDDGAMGQVETMPGGEPLWRVPKNLGRFALSMRTAEKYAKQATSANGPALCSSTGRGEQINEAVGETSRWVVPGSRLLSRFQVRLTI